MASLKRPGTTSYRPRSSIDTIALNCLVFEKIAFFGILATDRQTNEQMDRTDALSRSRYCERRLNKRHRNCNIAYYGMVGSHRPTASLTDAELAAYCHI